MPISLTSPFPKRDNAFNFHFWCLRRPMKPGSLRRCTSLLLVVSLLAPGPGFAQIPGTSQSPQPAPPTARPTPVPPPPVAPAAPRGLTPGPDYRLAPGDLLDVQIAGRLDVIRQQTYVDLEGVIS